MLFLDEWFLSTLSGPCMLRAQDNWFVFCSYYNPPHLFITLIIIDFILECRLTLSDSFLLSVTHQSVVDRPLPCFTGEIFLAILILTSIDDPTAPEFDVYQITL